MQHNPYLDKCIELISETIGWGDHDKWTHPQFVELSKLIYEKSGVLISVSSLKRIFGKIKSNHEPQRETRNALASFLGYEGWEHFVAQNPIAFKQEKEVAKKERKKYSKALYSIIVLIVVLVVFIFSKIFREKQVDYSSIKFTGKYLTGSSPHSVVFNYDIQNIPDSVFIDYDDSFSEIKREHLPKEHNAITHHYILPDLYKINLIHRNKIIRTLHVNLFTQGWQSYLAYDDLKHFFPVDMDKEEGLLEVEPKAIYETELVRKDEETLIKYRLVQDFGINGDHFTLKARVKDLKKIKTLQCFMAAFVVHGDSGKIKASFAQNDCIHNTWLRCGDLQLDGRFDDLSFLSTDFSQWQELEISMQNQKLTLKINNAIRFEQSVSAKIGNIRALLFDTTVSGVLNTIELTDNKTGVQYLETYN